MTFCSSQCGSPHSSNKIDEQNEKERHSWTSVRCKDASKPRRSGKSNTAKNKSLEGGGGRGRGRTTTFSIWPSPGVGVTTNGRGEVDDTFFSPFLSFSVLFLLRGPSCSFFQQQKGRQLPKRGHHLLVGAGTRPTQRTLNKLATELWCRNFVNKTEHTKSVPNVQKKDVCNVHVFQLSFHFAQHPLVVG